MRIKVSELCELGLWLEYCTASGTSEWALRDGRIEYEEELELTSNEARALLHLPPLKEE